MTTRSWATLSHIVAFAGFLALMGAWVAQGGHTGRPTLVVTAFVWMLLIGLWQTSRSVAQRADVASSLADRRRGRFR